MTLNSGRGDTSGSDAPPDADGEFNLSPGMEGFENNPAKSVTMAAVDATSSAQDSSKKRRNHGLFWLELEALSSRDGRATKVTCLPHFKTRPHSSIDMNRYVTWNQWVQ